MRAWTILLLPILFLIAKPASGQGTRVYVGSGVIFRAGPGDAVDFWKRGPDFRPLDWAADG